MARDRHRNNRQADRQRWHWLPLGGPRTGSYTAAAIHLALGGLLGQVLGMSSHVLLANLLGAEGVGLLGLLGSFLAMLFVPILAGIPSGVASEVARAADGDPRVHTLLRRTMGWLLAAAALMLLAGGALADQIHLPAWQRVARLIPVHFFLPTLAAAACAAVLRGYFHARRAGGAVVAGQLGEQIARLSAMAALFGFLMPTDRRVQLMIVIAAMTVGEFFGLLLLWRQYRRGRRAATPSVRVPTHDRPRLRGVLAYAVPAGAGRCLMAISRFAEASLIPALLVRSGLSWPQAMAAYGTLFGMAAPLLVLPEVFTGALHDLLVPALAETRHARPARAYHRIQRALLLAAILGVGGYLLLQFFGQSLGNLLYPGTAAAHYIHLLAPLAILIGLDQTLTGILRGLGRPSIPMWTDVAGLTGRLAIIVTLVPTHGMQAVCWALAASWAISVIGNLWAVGYWSRGPRLVHA